MFYLVELLAHGGERTAILKDNSWTMLNQNNRDLIRLWRKPWNIGLDKTEEKERRLSVGYKCMTLDNYLSVFFGKVE